MMLCLIEMCKNEFLRILTIFLCSVVSFAAGADNNAVHRIPRPYLLVVLRLLGREGQRLDGRHQPRTLHQLRRRPLVGSGAYTRPALIGLSAATGDQNVTNRRHT